MRRRARGARRRGPADPPARTEVQPPGEDLAARRLPRPRSARGLAAAQGRARGEARRRPHLPRAVRPSAARARLAKEALEEAVPIRRCTTSMGAAHPVRTMRPGRHGPLPRAVRRPHRPRALRRARPMARLLPGFQPGRAPRSARTPHDPPGRGGAVRGGGLGPRPAARARRGPAGGRGSTPGSSTPGGSSCAPATASRCGSTAVPCARRGAAGEPLAVAVPARARRRAGGRALVDRASTVRASTACDRAPAEPVEGGAALARVLAAHARARRREPRGRVGATTAG